MPATSRRPTGTASSTDRAELGRVLLRMAPGQLRAYLATLDATDLEIAHDAQQRAMAEQRQVGWRADPYTMARHLEGDDFEDFAFQRYLGQRFRDAVTGVHPFQIWNLPAQLGKTAVVRRGVAWALDRDPTTPIIYTSYGAALAENSARWIRDYGKEHASELRYRLREDATKVAEWMTTEGGGLKAAGMQGAISGFPAAGIVIDDPHKNWQTAHSAAEQQNVWETYKSVLRVRLRMGGWLIIIHTRWCEDDLTGLVLRDARQTGERWLHVRLPMLAEENDALGRDVGEPLEPRQYDRPAALARAAALGSYLANAMEQQNPVPVEGGLIKRAWWVIQQDMPERCDEWLTSWDMKLKDVALKGDYVVGQVWGRVGSDFYCYDQLRGQWSQNSTVAAIALMCVRYPQVTRHIIENTGNGPEVMAELRKAHPDWTLSEETAGELGITEHERPLVEAVMRRGLPGLVPNNPKGDKRVRMLAVSPFIEGRNVHLRDAPFALVLVGEAAQFPRTGVPDDAVDACSQALAILSRTAGTTSVMATAAGQQLGRPRPGQQVPARARIGLGRRNGTGNGMR